MSNTSVIYLLLLVTSIASGIESNRMEWSATKLVLPNSTPPTIPFTETRITYCVYACQPDLSDRNDMSVCCDVIVSIEYTMIVRLPICCTCLLIRLSLRYVSSILPSSDVFRIAILQQFIHMRWNKGYHSTHLTGH